MKVCNLYINNLPYYRISLCNDYPRRERERERELSLNILANNPHKAFFYCYYTVFGKEKSANIVFKSSGGQSKSSGEQYKSIGNQFKSSGEQFKSSGEQFKSNDEQFKSINFQFKSTNFQFKSDCPTCKSIYFFYKERNLQ